MRLVPKFTLWYLAITFLVLLISGFIQFFTFRAKIDFEEAMMLRERLNFAARRLEKGATPEQLRRRRIEVVELDMDQPEIEFTISDTLAYHEFLQRDEKQVKVYTSKKINDTHYYLSAYYGLVESDDITEAVLTSLGWTILILLIVTAVLALLVSRTILAPFNHTLTVIQAFQLKRQEPVVLPKSRTKEFEELNLFLADMMHKARNDYQSLKEFTENASHELQTPIAIMRGKLEFLFDTPLTDEQARLLASCQQALDKLSKMGQSLSLLTKIENREFVAPEEVDLSQMLTDALFAFQELLELKSIHLEHEITPGIRVKMHPVLADILLSNLLSNAIRHNLPQQGYLKVVLDKDSLLIENSGEPLKENASLMFERFKKGSGNSNSIGLGLAIVQRICEQSKLRVIYENAGEQHRIRLFF